MKQNRRRTKKTDPVKLTPLQTKGKRRALKEPSFALFMEQGTGKTPVSIKVVEEWYRRKKVQLVIVFCPNCITFNWELELHKFITRVPFEVVRLRGKGKKNWIKQIEQLQEEDGPLKILVVNYDKATILEKELNKLDPDFFILDESQRVKNRNTKRSKAIYRLTRTCFGKLLLSGTPAIKYEDLFMQFKILDPSIFGTRWVEFRDEYCRMGGFKKKEIVGYRNTRKLKQIVREHSYRIKLRDAVDLPPITNEFLTCELNPKSQKAYSEIKEELYTCIDRVLPRSQLKATLRKRGVPYDPQESYISLFLKAEDYLNATSCDLVITQVMRLHQLTGGFLTLDSGEVIQLGDEKIKTLVDYMEYKQSWPTVIFCRFINEVDLVVAELKKKYPEKNIVNYRDKKNRDKNYLDFQEGKVDVMVLQIQSGSVGLNFQRADTLLFYSFTGAEWYAQARKRIERSGQERPMTIGHIMAEGTIDWEILKNIEKSLKRMDKLLD